MFIASENSVRLVAPLTLEVIGIFQAHADDVTCLVAVGSSVWSGSAGGELCGWKFDAVRIHQLPRIRIQAANTWRGTLCRTACIICSAHRPPRERYAPSCRSRSARVRTSISLCSHSRATMPCSCGAYVLESKPGGGGWLGITDPAFACCLLAGPTRMECRSLSCSPIRCRATAMPPRTSPQCQRRRLVLPQACHHRRAPTPRQRLRCWLR